MENLRSRINQESRFFDTAMSEKDRVDLLVSRSAMSGSIVHRPTSKEDIVSIIRKVVPQGSLILVETESELTRSLREHYSVGIINQVEDESLFSAKAVITSVDFAIAETASIVVSSRQHSLRLASTTAEIHIAINHPDQILSDLSDLPRAFEKYYGGKIPAGLVLISGPSKTSDIEMNLVVGVHGPGELHMIVY